MESWQWAILLGCAALILALLITITVAYSQQGKDLTADNMESFLEETTSTHQQGLSHYNGATINGRAIARFVLDYPELAVTIQTVSNPTGFSYKERRGLGKTAFQLTEEEKMYFIEESANFVCTLEVESGYFTSACFKQVVK